MGRKKLIQDQTREELSFELAAKAYGKHLTPNEVRFYMKLTDLTRETPDFRMSDVGNLFNSIFNTEES